MKALSFSANKATIHSLFTNTFFKSSEGKAYGIITLLLLTHEYREGNFLVSDKQSAMLLLQIYFGFYNKQKQILQCGRFHSELHCLMPVILV